MDSKLKTRMQDIAGVWGLEFAHALFGDNFIARPKTKRNGEDGLKYIVGINGQLHRMGLEVKLTQKNGYKLDVVQLGRYRKCLDGFYTSVVYAIIDYDCGPAKMAKSVTDLSVEGVGNYLAYHLNAVYLLDSDIVEAIYKWKGGFKWNAKKDSTKLKRGNEYVQLNSECLEYIFRDFPGFCAEANLNASDYIIQTVKPQAVKFRGKRLWKMGGVHSVFSTSMAGELNNEINRRLAAARGGELVEDLDKLYYSLSALFGGGEENA